MRMIGRSHPEIAGNAAAGQDERSKNCARAESRVEGHRIGRGPDGMFRKLF